MLFERVIGHQKIKDLFTVALESGKTGNAYLFSGTPGIGKKLFATELAKAITCNEKGGNIPCNTCSNCKRIDSGNYPDFHVLEPDGRQIKIGQIRNLIKEISYFPVESERRTVIIDNADAMNINAANTFLKTLEDAPTYTTFILVASKPYMLPETILSRCQVIKFPPLQATEIDRILTMKGIEFEKDLTRNLASGSIQTAIDLSGKLRLSEIEKVWEGFSNLSGEETSAIFDFAEKLSSNFDEMSDLLLIFKMLFLDVLRVSSGQNPGFFTEETGGAGESGEKYLIIVKKIAANNSMNILHRKLELLQKLEMDLRFNLNMKLATERMLLDLV